MSSTLVETVSLNYEDFHDSFLTCGTCLCMYDGQEHNPKLLPCSHTVCRSCLERIVQAQQNETNSLRCPICRETIPLPRGGVTSFPPSFLVNQLLDLMREQRRDVVPKCSRHVHQELFFCESCDTVFCQTCTGGQHNAGGASEHTVIPFSIAIKRMSEILLYKAQLCTRNLDVAYETVSAEIDKLESSVNTTVEQVHKSFQELVELVESRKAEVLEMVRRVSEEKKKVLQEQLDIIECEKEKIQEDCNQYQFQVEVRNITEKIGKLNEKLDMSCTLSEPRENAFMVFQSDHNDSPQNLVSALNRFGKVRVSTTFPALCTAQLQQAVTHLRTAINVTTVDYHGNLRTSGFDPLVVEVVDMNGVELPTAVDDNENGTYTVSYTPTSAGQHTVVIRIFNRPIRGSPFTVEVSEHNNPIHKVGSHGAGDLNFSQPTCVSVDGDNNVYVLDTGNSRIKVLTMNGEFVDHLGTHGVEKQGCLGMDVTQTNTLATVNWRTKHVTELNMNGDVVNKFVASELVEPVSIAVNNKREYLIGDNGTGCVLVYDYSGNLLRKIGRKGKKPGEFGLITSLTIGLQDEVIISDHRIQVFKCDGTFVREVPTGSDTRGQYGGVVVDKDGCLLATRTEKGRSFVQVFRNDYTVQFVIDSFDDKLKRPSGLATTEDGRLIVVDLGNNCVKVYKYR